MGASFVTFYHAYLINTKQLIEIDNRCMESCKHVVTINGLQREMNGMAIYKLLHKNNMEIPSHFLTYAPSKN